MEHVKVYKTAKELGITEKEHAALQDVARRLANGEIEQHTFYMGMWSMCICGHMNGGEKYSPALDNLFTGEWDGDGKSRYISCKNRSRAALAIQNFLMGHDAY